MIKLNNISQLRRKRLTSIFVIFLTFLMITIHNSPINASINQEMKIQVINQYKESFATYLGGKYNDIPYGSTVDKYGNIYVTGYTYSNDFPTKNAWNSKNASSISYTDAYISKFSPTGYLLYSTYIGGSNYDYGQAVAADDQGNVYVVGETWSQDFPTINAYQSASHGGIDAFIVKLDPNGQPIFSTLFGGSDNDYAFGVTSDSNGNIFVVGNTLSTDFLTKNTLNTTFSGIQPGFLAKFDKNGVLDYSMLIPNSNIVVIKNIVLDSDKNIYIGGYSNGDNLPMVNSWNNTFGGVSDGFIMKLNSTGWLLTSTYFGGSGVDLISGITLDNDNNVLFAGSTASNNLPVMNAFSSYQGGFRDMFVGKINMNTNELIYATYLSTTTDDESGGIAVDSQGNAIMTGYTDSSNFNITTNAYQNTTGGYIDIIMAKISPTGKLLYSTYLGGSQDDRGLGIHVNQFDELILIAQTGSTGIGTTNGYYSHLIGNFDTFIAKFSDLDTPPTFTSSAYQNSVATTTITIAGSNNINNSSNSNNDLFDPSLLQNPAFVGVLGIGIISVLVNIVFLIKRR